MGQDISIAQDINVVTSHVTTIEGSISNNKLMMAIKQIVKRPFKI